MSKRPRYGVRAVHVAWEVFDRKLGIALKPSRNHRAHAEADAKGLNAQAAVNAQAAADAKRLNAQETPKTPGKP